MTEFLDAKTLNNALVRTCVQEIIKSYGPSIFPTPNLAPIPSIPTGSIALDEAIGIGGVPRGRIVLVCGDPGTAKSSLCLSMIKEAQLLMPEKLNIYVDLESGAYTDEYAHEIGVDLDPNKFLPIHPDYAEQGMVAIYNLISTGQIGVCVWDSIAGSVPKEGMNNSAEENDSIANIARMLSKQLPKLANKCGKTGTTLVLVNQIRTQMGGHGVTWKDITGGYAQKFYSSVRIDLSKDKERDFSGAVDRETITARISKNKVSVPYHMANFDIRLGKGILKEANVLDMAASKGVPELIAKGGGWYYFYNVNKSTGETTEVASVRGKDKAVDWLVEHPDFRTTLEQAILGFGRETAYDEELEIGEDGPETITEDEVMPTEDEIPLPDARNIHPGQFTVYEEGCGPLDGPMLPMFGD